MFSAASVCLSVFLQDNMRTIKRMMKLGGYRHCTKISPVFDCHGQRSKVKVIGDKKTKKCGILFGSRTLGRGPRAAFFREPSSGALLRRWENQRMLSNSYVYLSPLDLRLTTFV